MDVGNHLWESSPFSDGQAAGHFHQALDEIQLLFVRVANGQISPVHVDFPRHLFRAAELHLGANEEHREGVRSEGISSPPPPRKKKHWMILDTR